MIEPMSEVNHLSDFALGPSNNSLRSQTTDDMNDAGQRFNYNITGLFPYSQGHLQETPMQQFPLYQSNTTNFHALPQQQTLPESVYSFNETNLFNNNKMFNTVDDDSFNTAKDLNYNHFNYDSNFNSRNFNISESSLLPFTSFMDQGSVLDNASHLTQHHINTESKQSSIKSGSSYNDPIERPFSQQSPLIIDPTIPKFNCYPQVSTPVKLEQSDNTFSGLDQPEKNYRVIRGVSAGGCTTRPPKHSINSDSIFLPVELKLNGASVEHICFPKWSAAESEDMRRIVRIERLQNGPNLIANFSILGSAKENSEITIAPPNVKVVEVSCLQCSVNPIDDIDSSDDGIKNSSKGCTMQDDSGNYYSFYITSVEVLDIVELLIGTELSDPAERRRQKGRIRSNLVPFWSKRPISSRMNESSNSEKSYSSNASNQDFRLELARRIMGYEIRKPRGFDKEVRILRWDKLIPALRRALQSYYTEIPQSDSHLEFNLDM